MWSDQWKMSMTKRVQLKNPGLHCAAAETAVNAPS